MTETAPHLSHYLVEWYRDGLPQDTMDQSYAMLISGARLASDTGECATVVLTMSVPTDDVIFCVFCASSSDIVAAACSRAGIPAARVTPAMVAA